MEDREGFRPALIAWARLQRQIYGHKKCRRIGVGGMIRELRTEIPENGTGAYVSAARADVQLLESFCRLKCQRCKGLPVMPDPPRAQE